MSNIKKILGISAFFFYAESALSGEALVNGIRIAPDSHTCFHLSNVGMDAHVEITIYDHDGKEYTGPTESWGSYFHPNEWHAVIPANATRVFCSKKVNNY